MYRNQETTNTNTNYDNYLLTALPIPKLELFWLHVGLTSDNQNASGRKPLSLLFPIDGDIQLYSHEAELQL